MFDYLPTNPMSSGVQFAGAVDQISPTGGIRGWALDASNPSASLELQVWCSGLVLASTHANLPRTDIAAAIRTESNCGFAFSWQSFDQVYVQRLLAGREQEPVHILAPAGNGMLEILAELAPEEHLQLDQDWPGLWASLKSCVIFSEVV